MWYIGWSAGQRVEYRWEKDARKARERAQEEALLRTKAEAREFRKRARQLSNEKVIGNHSPSQQQHVDSDLSRSSPDASESRRPHITSELERFSPKNRPDGELRFPTSPNDYTQLSSTYVNTFSSESPSPGVAPKLPSIQLTGHSISRAVTQVTKNFEEEESARNKNGSNNTSERRSPVAMSRPETDLISNSPNIEALYDQLYGSDHKTVEEVQLALPCLTGVGLHGSCPLATESTVIEEMQILGRNSFVTRITEVEIANYDILMDPNLRHPSQEISISSDSAPNSLSDTEDDDDRQEGQRTTTPLNLDRFRATPRIPIRRGPHDPDSQASEPWICPREWNYIQKDGTKSNDQNGSPRTSRTTGRSITQLISSNTAMSDLQHSIEEMINSRPAVMIQKLLAQCPTLSTSKAYRAFAFERELWLLTSLRHLFSRANGDTYETSVNSSVSSGRVLSLYESEASSSFLAASCRPRDCYQLSRILFNPHRSAHDTHRSKSKSMPTSSLRTPFPDEFFSDVYCLPLATVAPTAAVFRIIQDCHRILTPNGTLHLTILDPAPNPSTMGPLLQSWLERNLLLNLEERSQIIHPSCLLPRLLEKSGFSCKTEKEALVEFPSVLKNIKPSEEELLSVSVGRALWRSLWGSSVQGRSWWEDEEAILNECRALKTQWTCRVVQYVKPSELSIAATL